MQALLEFTPLAVFLIAYRVAGIYAATAALMAAMGILLIIDYVRGRRVPPMHALSAVLVFAFGTATLLLHNQRFIQWKPTVFFWLASLAFLGSFWIGDRTLAQRLLSAALPVQTRVEPALWRRLNWVWIVFYGLLGILNLVIAFNASERTWVNFKVFGLTVATFVFIGAQIAWLARRGAAAVQRA
ncbi:MAG TPA: inner membrane-spanning protein YciB [Steroidobacteraceae bacterium]|jgi:intracellular septation protein|nr:inner membrane-spanning protein YciB [Steroidobacteraceae bacterium]